MNLVFFEDSHYGDFYPLTLSRPACMLLSGISEIYRKWVEALKPADYSFLVREYLTGFVSLTTGKKVNDLTEDDILLVNGRFLPSEKMIEVVRDLKRGEALTGGGLIAFRPAVKRTSRLTEALRSLFDTDAERKALSFFSVKEIEAEGFHYLWELINANGDIITREFEDYYSRVEPKLPGMRNVEIINPNHVRAGLNSTIAPAVVIDASDGPVIIGDNVNIEPFTFIKGPVFVGHDCRIVGGRIGHGCSLGRVCRVGGEVENSIMLGYCNKYHDGFIGHAYLGEWINLGAMTTNSNLKNNYSNIRVIVGDNAVDTGSIKAGCFIGDHTKTGIGTTLNTGISVGFSCNLYGAGLFAQNRIRSFSWGTPEKLVDYRLEKAIETAAASMARRNVKMTSVYETLFTHIHGLEFGT